MAKVKTGISRLNSEGVIGKGQTISEKMTGNPVYVDLQAELPALNNAITDLIDANNEAKFVGGKVAHAHKRVCDAKLRRVINDLAPQVQTASGGDIDKILGGGWDVVKKPEHGERPATPENFRSILTAYARTIKLNWRGDKLALYYGLEMMNEKGEWIVVASSSRNHYTVGELTSGKEYTFRIIAIGSNGASPYSDLLVARAA